MAILFLTKNFGKNMKSTYKIIWSDIATNEFDNTYDYLINNWTYKECDNLVKSTNIVLNLIRENPFLYPKAHHHNVRKAVILKYNTMYYRVKNEEIEIISFFSNRQKPDENI